MAGRSQGNLRVWSWSAAALGAVLATAMALTPAAAQSVPLPIPAPQPKTGTLPPPPTGSSRAAPAPAPAQEDRGSIVPSWFPSILGGKKEEPQQQPQQQQQPPGTTAGFEARQRALVDRVSNYLSSVKVMSGDFVQVAADGRRANGQFFIMKPGRVRFDYEPPSPIDIVADGSSVVVRDRKLATQQVHPLSQTPLRYLLQDRIDLLKDTNVTAVYADETYVTVVVEEKQILIGTTRLTMMFSAKDFTLKQWVVTDPQGYDTTVALSKVDLKSRPDPNMFKIDYTDYSR
jgi:outer membrane lipoprotein-sorting protein